MTLTTVSRRADSASTRGRRLRALASPLLSLVVLGPTLQWVTSCSPDSATVKEWACFDERGSCLCLDRNEAPDFITPDFDSCPDSTCCVLKERIGPTGPEGVVCDCAESDTLLNGCVGRSREQRVDTCPPTKSIEPVYSWHCKEQGSGCHCFGAEGPAVGSCDRPCCKLHLTSGADGDMQECSCSDGTADGICLTDELTEPVPSCPPPGPPVLIERTISGWSCGVTTAFGDGRHAICSCNAARGIWTAPCLPVLSCCWYSETDGSRGCQCMNRAPCEVPEGTTQVSSCPPPKGP